MYWLWDWAIAFISGMLAAVRLLPDRKLKTLLQQPFKLFPENKDGHSLLLFWYWEDRLKNRYDRLISGLEEASRDMLPILKGKTLKELAYVDFSDETHLKEAIAKNRSTLNGKKLSIRKPDPTKGKKQEPGKDGVKWQTFFWSVENSEYLSDLLKERNIPHNVLNARPKYAAREAETVAQAGRNCVITISTNMAGRGALILFLEEIL